MRDYIRDELSKALAMFQRVAADENLAAELERIATACCQALRSGNKILLAGNGGSAADAQHIAAELVSRFHYERPGLAAFALTTDTSALTAIGNDYGYDRIFARQLNAVGVEGDVFIALSTSGRSPNILRGLEEARCKKITAVGLTGSSGGDMPPLCDYCVHVPAVETARIQEGHILLGHILCGLIECELFSGHGPIKRPSGIR